MQNSKRTLSQKLDQIILQCTRSQPLDDGEIKHIFVQVAVGLKEHHSHKLGQDSIMNNPMEKALQGQIEELRGVLRNKTLGYAQLQRKVQKIGETLRNDFQGFVNSINQTLQRVQKEVAQVKEDLQQKLQINVFESNQKDVKVFLEENKKQLEYQDYQIKQLKQQAHKLFKKSSKLQQQLQSSKSPSLETLRCLFESSKPRRMSEGEAPLCKGKEGEGKEGKEGKEYRRGEWVGWVFGCSQEVLFGTYHSLRVSEPSIIIGRRRITQGFSVSILVQKLGKGGVSIGIAASADLPRICNSGIDKDNGQGQGESQEISLFEYHSSGDVFVSNRFVKNQGRGFGSGDTITMRVSFGASHVEWLVGNETKTTIKRDAIEGVQRGWVMIIKCADKGDVLVVI